MSGQLDAQGGRGVSGDRVASGGPLPGSARPAPGDARPRQLDQPPGDRYLSAEPPARIAPRTNMARSGVFGIAAGLLTAAAFAVVSGDLDLSIALLLVSVVGGFLIGRAAARGAWSGLAHAPSRRVVALAVAIAALTWLAGEVGAYVVALALRPDSSLSLGDRMAQISFLDWLGPQFGPREILELFLLGGFAWFASRSEGPQWPSS